jgi:hypothetical protein
MNVDEAVRWYKTELGVTVTPRYLKECTNVGSLRCAIVAGRRTYSSESLYDFIVTRPSRKCAPHRALT